MISILEQKQQAPEEAIDEQKLRYIASPVASWDYFGIHQANYLALDKNEKSRMFTEYYGNLVLQYFGGKKILLFLLFGIFWSLAHCFNSFWLSDPGFFLEFF